MKYILLVVLSILFISCTEKPAPEPIVIEKIEHSDFLSSMINEYSLRQENLKKIQFYTSHDIVLHKQKRLGSVSVREGTLLIDKSSQSEELIIKALTPCVFIRGNEEKITVKFEDIVLDFVNPCFKSVSKNGKYYLAAMSWVDNVGTININGVRYKALGMSGDAYLSIDKKSLENTQRGTTIVEGRVVE